ncbi:3-deoxy-D-manno-octulosonic acid transferase [Stappia taiwanensis]|uniref:3-deoxy-D-manno-octulosonic acid transferase n=1 Tax=Stappia taiwanensis TaxID=992267 RepID=A0A838XSI6_9HYPH|nr:3-deoxy-D-manno-octulosonic acid transferase [Stappia taiwanensis]MBA4612021.1 3-deoxy-D-manno-octulosonic acid transferase [Stappia taiwanensis]
MTAPTPDPPATEPAAPGTANAPALPPAKAGWLSQLIGKTLLAGYRLFGTLAGPGLRRIHARRVEHGKEDPARRGERFGHPSLPRPEGRLVWLHAASVGELNAARALIDAIATTHGPVLVTTGTVTSARIAAANLPAGAFHQYVPYDTPPNLDRFLNHWRPDLAIVMESEIWPATITALDARGIPLISASATMSPRSARGWRRLRPLAAQLFPRIALSLAQTPEDADRLRALGVAQVEVTGNLKIDSATLAADPQALASMRLAIGTRPTWLAASTHDGEEAIIGAVHIALRHRLPGLLSILVPRHPERGPAIAEMLRAKGLSVALRSAGDALTEAQDIYIGDTIGEMGLYYRLAPVAFIGKTLIPGGGGQNPLEAARLDTALLAGPNFGVLEDIYHPLIEAGGMEIIADDMALADAVETLLNSPEARQDRARRAARFVDAQSGALAATLSALAPYLDPDLGPHPEGPAR